MPKTGDRLKIKTKDKEYEGTLMPSTDPKILILKLDSGYNIGIKNKEIKSKKLIKTTKKKKEIKQKKIKKKKSLKNITILHTGGTVASRVSYETGGVISKFTPEDLLEMVPEIKNIVNINTKLIRNMSSEDLRFYHYNLLAKEIEKEIKSDGIIITHGTDTMAMTSCALAFILEDINIPVLLVGAQRSSDRGSSDAFLNLKRACEFIAKTDFIGVAICMHSSSEDKECNILPPCKSRKFHSSRRDAFKPVNDKPIAIIKENIKFLKDYKKKNKRKLKIKPIKENLKIGILKMHPQMFSEELKTYAKFDGLILEGSGLGHFPITKIDKKTLENEKIFTELKKLAKRIPVIMTTQCIFGSVDMNVYEPGRKTIEAGVLGNYTDMLAETAFIKLAWLLSNHPKQIKELISKNLRGEISSRLEYKEKFI